MFNLISSTHATVSGLEKDLLESGWRKSNELNKGSIIIWKAADQGGEIHRHSGFFMGNNVAISNSTIECVPIEHHKGRAEELRRWGSTSDAQEHESRVNDLLNKKK